jgi:uncharacterized protein
MIFNIRAQNSEGHAQTFLYDNMINRLTDQNGLIFNNGSTSKGKPYIPFSKDLPLRKSKNIRVLKIQLGLSCNYSCDYCSQRFVERAPETSKKHIDAFLTKLESLNFSEENGLQIEFWGGEPLVYWKTLKPLAEAIREKYKWDRPIRFSTITNGSLFTDEICDWLYESGFSIGFSHDGPGQHVRGEDPFDNPKLKETILAFYKRMKAENRISINAMLNSKNYGRKDIHNWFINLTGDENVELGEGSVVDAYDEGGYENLISTKADHFAFRKTAFNDIYSNNGNIGFNGIVNKVDAFTKSVLSQTSAEFLNQKCGMDDENVVAMDLMGNIITCQNVSSVQISGNGESHLSGTVEKIDEVEITTATHWSNRDHCSECPVLHLCKGSCMYLEGKYWDKSCQNAYSDNVALFALSLEKITGYIPILIDAPHLPLERQDIWGGFYDHAETPIRKIIPIKTVSTQKTIVDGTEVYAQANTSN